MKSEVTRSADRSCERLLAFAAASSHPDAGTFASRFLAKFPPAKNLPAPACRVLRAAKVSPASPCATTATSFITARSQICAATGIEDAGIQRAWPVVLEEGGLGGS